MKSLSELAFYDILVSMGALPEEFEHIWDRIPLADDSVRLYNSIYYVYSRQKAPSIDDTYVWAHELVRELEIFAETKSFQFPPTSAVKDHLGPMVSGVPIGISILRRYAVLMTFLDYSALLRMPYSSKLARTG
jgi:hypothetical protein